LSRVGIRANGNRTEFFLKDSDHVFVPQGVNWVRLSKFGDLTA
jgi:hypothetical protein